MAFRVYSTDKTSERGFPWLWYVRLAQMGFTIAIIALAASNASVFNSIGCSVPSKLGYNIAAAALSFIVVLVLILSTGKTEFFRVIPWIAWGQLALDGFMFIIWIAAAGVSQYSCPDLCHACAGFDWVWSSGLYCTCTSYLFYDKRDQSPASKGLAGPLEERAYYNRSRNGSGAGRKNAKIAFDAIMVVLFAFTTAATIYWIFKNRKTGAATGPSSTPENPPAPQKTGALPPTAAPGYTPTEKPDAPLYSQPSYPPPQQQQQQPPPPQMQQSPYPSEPTQQSPYPASAPAPQGAADEYYHQPPQGSASDYYNQPRSQTPQTIHAPNRAEMPSPAAQPEGR